MNVNDRHSHSLPAAYAHGLLRYQWLILALIVLLTLISVYQLAHAQFGNSLLQVFMDDPAEYQRYTEQARALGGDSDDSIYLAGHEGPSLFTAEKLNAIRAAARDLEQLTEVERVVSLVDIPRTDTPRRLSLREVAARAVLRRQLLDGRVPRESIQLESYWPNTEARQRKIKLDVLREQMLRDEFVVGTLLAKNGDAWGMVVKLREGRALSVAQQIGLQSRLTETIQKHGLGTSGVYAAGLVVSQGWLFREMLHGLAFLAPLVLFTVSLTVYILFRRLSIVLLAVVIAVLATLWSVALTVFAFGEISVLVAASPLVVIVISTSDLIHLASAYREEVARGFSRDEAIRRMICDVGGACLLTGGTTIIGFASLATVAVPATRHFALTAASGVAAALMLQTLVPITFHWLPQPRFREDRLHHAANWLLDTIVAWCRRISLWSPWGVIVACALIIGMAAIGVTRLEFSSDFPLRFPSHHPLRSSVRFLNEHFSGTTNVELLVHSKNGVLQPEVLNHLASFEQQVLQWPEVRAVHSVLQPFRLINRVIGYESATGLPPTAAAADASLRLTDTTGHQPLQLYVDKTRQTMRVFVQITPSDFMAVARLGGRIEDLARHTLPADATAHCSGTFVIVGRTVDKIIASQMRGNWLCVVAVTVIMAIALGSLRVGLLAQVPNLVPLAIFAGLVMLTYDRVDSDLLGLPMVALGIAVDDTIHFLHRFRIQLAEGESRRQAVETSYRYTGRAMVQSTMILCIGLLPCAISSYLAVWMLGTYLVFTLGCGLLADLLLVPAMIETGIIRWRK